MEKGWCVCVYVEKGTLWEFRFTHWLFSCGREMGLQGGMGLHVCAAALW